MIDESIREAKNIIQGKNWDGTVWYDSMENPFLILNEKITGIPKSLLNAFLIIGMPHSCIEDLYTSA